MSKENFMNLIDFFNVSQEKTDKYDLGYIDAFYDSFFHPRVETAKLILEIGVQSGGSIKLWRNFFVNSTVYGLDVDYCDAVDQCDRIVHMVCDAYSFDTVNQFQRESFDIVIDDGPHTFDSMVFFILYYLDIVKPGGIMVLEDIIDISWTQMLVDIIKHKSPDSKIHVYNMKGKQKTQHLIDRWKNGLDVIVIEK